MNKIKQPKWTKWANKQPKWTKLNNQNEQNETTEMNKL